MNSYNKMDLYQKELFDQGFEMGIKALQLLKKGKRVEEIAEILDLSPEMIESVKKMAALISEKRQ